VALDLDWAPVQDLIEDIHNGDPSVRQDWPWCYWGLEPFMCNRHDWSVRYASVFQLGQASLSDHAPAGSTPSDYVAQHGLSSNCLADLRVHGHGQ
jgi:hypothetical protein